MEFLFRTDQTSEQQTFIPQQQICIIGGYEFNYIPGVGWIPIDFGEYHELKTMEEVLYFIFCYTGNDVVDCNYYTTPKQ